jgi:hypothetical protein
MSSSTSLTTSQIPAIVRAGPIRFPASVQMISLVLFAIGVLTFVIALSMGEQKHTWGVFHVNALYFLIMSAASSGFAAVFHITNSQWSRPIRRIFEGAYPYFCFAAVPFIIEWIGGGSWYLFEWARHPEDLHMTRHGWLSVSFVYLRDIAAMAIIWFVVSRVLAYGRSQDAVRAQELGLGSELKQYPLLDSSEKKDLKELNHLRWRFAPAAVIVYAFGISLIAFDQSMSVDPHWFSTLFGAFLFMSGVYTAVAWASMLQFFLRKNNDMLFLGIQKNTLWDLGKLLFGFGIFWTYLFWSHYLPFWYANMPEETHWLILRARLEPWHTLGWGILWACFLCPFFLGLSRDVKQVPHLLALTGLIVACGQWLLHYIIIMPYYFQHEIPFNFIDIGVTLGFVGAFVFGVIRYLSKVPAIYFGDM